MFTFLGLNWRKVSSFHVVWPKFRTQFYFIYARAFLRNSRDATSASLLAKSRGKTPPTSRPPLCAGETSVSPRPWWRGVCPSSSCWRLSQSAVWTPLVRYCHVLSSVNSVTNVRTVDLGIGPTIGGYPLYVVVFSRLCQCVAAEVRVVLHTAHWGIWRGWCQCLR